MVKKIIMPDIYWKGKLLVFTWHFKEEFEKLKRPLEFILYILDNGQHIKVSKRQNKYNVLFPYQKSILCLSYVEQDNIILIHIKPRSK